MKRATICILIGNLLSLVPVEKVVSVVIMYTACPRDVWAQKIFDKYCAV